jgi:hypothetical protein
MKKRFVICLNSSTKEQDELLKQFIKEKNFGWWHWLSNTWLLIDDNGTFSAANIRDELKNIYPVVHMLVLELNGKGDSWAGFGTITPEKDMFKWLKDYWLS